MVWRIHFTADDLERIQVRPTLGPLAETVTAMCLLRCPQQPRAPYRQWRGQVKGRLTPQMAALTALIPPGSKGVDLSMLTGTAATLEQGVQALLTVPREHLLMEMEFTDRGHKLPAAVWAVAETGGQARLQLAAAAVAAHQALVAPYWTPDPRLPARRARGPPPDAGGGRPGPAAGLATEPVGALAPAGARGAGARRRTTCR